MLKEKLLIEYNKKDRGGIYGYTQRSFAYNSNRIEGSTLTERQTASLFEAGTIMPDGDEIFRSKDIEEMNGHFAMFNHMLETIEEPLTEELIKKYHYFLKIGVFEDRANGYPVGEYKKFYNMVSDIDTAKPDEVSDRMKVLIAEYENMESIGLQEISRFHAEFEKIHPFQDGNGRTGRGVLFKECLRKGVLPFIISDANKPEYYQMLNLAQNKKEYEGLVAYLEKEQHSYFAVLQKFLYRYE
ncbi:MAG: Fic family protein [Lachnospiraceae bacterium]